MKASSYRTLLWREMLIDLSRDCDSLKGLRSRRVLFSKFKNMKITPADKVASWFVPNFLPSRRIKWLVYKKNWEKKKESASFVTYTAILLRARIQTELTRLQFSSLGAIESRSLCIRKNNTSPSLSHWIRFPVSFTLKEKMCIQKVEVIFHEKFLAGCIHFERIGRATRYLRIMSSLGTSYFVSFFFSFFQTMPCPTGK